MKTTKVLTRLSIVAALYIALCMHIPSSGQIQFRFAEILNLLPVISPLYILPVTLGCAITNLLTSDLGIIDVVVGSLCTLVATFMVYKTRKNLILASLWPLLNGVVIAAEGYYIAGWPFWMTALWITISEFIIVTLIGVPLFKMMLKNKTLVDLLSFDSYNTK